MKNSKNSKINFLKRVDLIAKLITFLSILAFQLSEIVKILNP
jgi:hypothetical protein